MAAPAPQASRGDTAKGSPTAQLPPTHPNGPPSPQQGWICRVHAKGSLPGKLLNLIGKEGPGPAPWAHSSGQAPCLSPFFSFCHCSTPLGAAGAQAQPPSRVWYRWCMSSLVAPRCWSPSETWGGQRENLSKHRGAHSITTESHSWWGCPAERHPAENISVLTAQGSRALQGPDPPESSAAPKESVSAGYPPDPN